MSKIVFFATFFVIWFLWYDSCNMIPVIWFLRCDFCDMIFASFLQNFTNTYFMQNCLKKKEIKSYAVKLQTVILREKYQYLWRLFVLIINNEVLWARRVICLSEHWEIWVGSFSMGHLLLLADRRNITQHLLIDWNHSTQILHLSSYC